MLSGLRVGNFKAFGPTQRMPIKPLTFLYGPNSGGKSSLIHALVLAAHGQHTGDLRAMPARTRWGDAVDLGGFGQYVHRRDSSLRVEIGLEFGVKAAREGTADNLSLAAVSELLATDSAATATLTIGPGAPDGSGVLERYRLDLDGVPLLSWSADGWWLNHEHPALVWAVQRAATGRPPGNLKPRVPAALAKAAQGLEGRLTAERRGLLPVGVRERAGVDLSAGAGWLGKRHTTARSWELAVLRVVDGLVRQLSQAVEHELDGLEYLGPLRGLPPRDFRAEPPPGGWERLPPGLYQWYRIPMEYPARLPWIGEWLSKASPRTPYEVRYRAPEWFREAIRDLVPEAPRAGVTASPEDHAAVGPCLGRIGQPPDAPQVGGAGGAQPDPLLRAEGRVPTHELEVEITDRRTNTRVTPHDIGVGISQVVPVLGLAFGYGGSLIAIEQPEIHLHPALQGELADLFMESALTESYGLRRSFILETHSEYLLLRVMRRMRETAEGRLPETCPRVTPDHVAVLYVEPDGPTSVVREIELDEEGRLLSRWPGGFFEEGFHERFS